MATGSTALLLAGSLMVEGTTAVALIAVAAGFMVSVRAAGPKGVLSCAGAVARCLRTEHMAWCSPDVSGMAELYVQYFFIHGYLKFYYTPDGKHRLTFQAWQPRLENASLRAACWLPPNQG